MGARRRWVGWVVASFVASIVMLLLVPWPAAGAASGTPEKISVFGDSVLLGAREELLAQFADQQITVDAVEDRSLLGAIDGFQRAGASLGDVVVLDLGYNDMADAAVFRSRVDAAMAGLAAVPRVIWLNQHDWGPGRAAMNAELAGAATRYPNLEVVDWNAEVVAHPDDVYADAIHLTPAGQTAMAALVRKQFDRAVTPTTIAATTAATTAAPATTTTRATARSPVASGRASTLTDDDGGISNRNLALFGAAALVLVGAVAVSFGGRGDRRGGRRAGRGTRRDR